MKPNVLSSAVILSALTATAALATEGLDDAPIYLDKTAITLDAGYMMDIDNLSVDHLTGASIGMSYIFNRTEKSAHSIGLSFGYFDGSESETYAPTTNKKETHDANYGFTVIDVETYSPHQKISQVIIPVILSYKYYRNVTESLSAYVGARAGVYVSKSSRKTTVNYNGYVDTIFNGASLGRMDESGSYYGKTMHTSISPTVGLEIGMEYKFAKNWAWNIGASIDASFSMNREVSGDKNSLGSKNAAFDSEISKETAVSATIYTGFSYQF